MIWRFVIPSLCDLSSGFLACLTLHYMHVDVGLNGLEFSFFDV